MFKILKNEVDPKYLKRGNVAEEIVKIYLEGVEMSLRVIQDFFLFLFIFFIICVIMTNMRLGVRK